MPGSLIVPAGGGSLAYAGLIGDNLTLYVEVGAALCAPRNTSAPVKPGGSLNGSNQPYINSDGSVNSLTGTNTYGLLYNPVSQYTNPLQTAVQNMIEFISLGGRNAVEGWTMQFATSGANTGWFPYSTTSGSGGLYWTHSISSATWDAQHRSVAACHVVYIRCRRVAGPAHLHLQWNRCQEHCHRASSDHQPAGQAPLTSTRSPTVALLILTRA